MKQWINFIRTEKFIGISFCILLASVSWFVAKLSSRYNERITLKVNYTDLPNEMYIDSTSLKTIDVEIEGTGFSLLKINLLKKNISLSINDLSYVGKGNYILPKNTINLIDYNLLPDVKLKNVYPDTLKIRMQRHTFKKVPILLNLPLHLAQDHILTKTTILPDSVLVYGVKKQIDTIKEIKVDAQKRHKQQLSYNEKIHLPKIKGINFSPSEITIENDIIRISETSFICDIFVKNIPSDYQIQLIPKKIPVIISGDWQVIKELTIDDFSIIADFKQRKENRIPLSIEKLPKGLKINDLPKDIEYLIKKN